MKRILATFALLLVTCGYAVLAQGLLAFHVVGDVKYKKGTAMVPLVMNAHLPASTVISIPAGGKVEFLDEANSRRISLTKAGNGSITAMSKEQGNSVSKIAVRYLAYVKKQMTYDQLVSAQRYTDFATVTREKVETKDENKDPFRAAFDDFKIQTQKNFDTFRDKCNKEYTDFVRQIWKEYKGEPYVPVPKDNMVRPETSDDTLSTGRLAIFDKIVKLFKPKKNAEQEKVEEEVKKEMAEPQPQPIEEIKEVAAVTPVQKQEQQFESMPVTLYGTEFTVRLGESQRINLGKINPSRVADALDYLSSKKYDNLLYDCLKIRKDNNLCDWAYLELLKTISDQFCGAGTSESALLCGWLYYQSGYKIRFAYDEDRHLYLLVASKHFLYGQKYPFVIEDDRYFPITEVPRNLYICQAKFPKSRTLSMFMERTPELSRGIEYKRTIRSQKFPEICIEVSVNPNLLDFYSHYPQSMFGNDVTTKWQVYGNTQMDEEVQQQIYPTLRSQLEGLSKKEAAYRLLDLVQSLPYAYDDSIWGGDRPFFAEETLHYPSCDCEDRAILYTRLVRDILDLPCVLIYYPNPGHLACAVHFEDGQTGVTYEYNGVDYTLCDGTFCYVPIGVQMSYYDNDNNGARVVPVEKNSKPLY